MAEVGDVAPEPEATFRPRIRPELDNNRAGASSPEPNCAICLGQLENISYTDNCLHRFCFACIQEWSKIKQECPLCKQNFSSIIHNVRSENDYDQCHVARGPPTLSEAWNQLVAAYRQGMERRQNIMEYQLRQTIQINGVTFMNRNEVSLPLLISLSERRSQQFRARVYREMLYSAALRNRTGIPRESSPEFYRSNPAELSRLESFFRRELMALLNSHTTVFDAVRSVKLELQISSIRSPAFHGLIRYYLGNTRAFIFRHELYNFAVSGYDVVGYDKYVKYYPHGVIGVPSRNAVNRNYLPEILQAAGVQEQAPDVQELHVELDEIEEIADLDETPPINQIIPSPTRDVLTISDSNSGSDDCEIIHVVRPQDRVFDVIYLSSDDDDIVHVIGSSSSSSSSSDSEFNIDTEEQQSVVTKEEHEPRVDFFNLPSTSQQSDNPQSYTPPLVLDLSMQAENCLSNQNQTPKTEPVHEDQQQPEIAISVKRSHSNDSSGGSNSSIVSMPSRTIRRRRAELRSRVTSRSESTSSEDRDSSSFSRHRPVRRRRRQFPRRHSSSSSSMSDSSEYYKHRSRSTSSSESDKKDRKRKLKRCKRERHGESSSRCRKSSQDKKSKKRKKRRSSKHRDSKYDSKHRRSEKKCSRRSH